MAEKTSTSSAEFLIDKYIFLDTCVIVKAKEVTPCFRDLFSLFNEKNCVIAIHSLIRSEFLRGSSTLTFINQKKEFLKQFKFFSLPITSEIIESSVLLSNIYSNKNVLISQISLVDCINAAFLMKYSDNLFLLTLDNKDYPLFVFDRVYIYTIDTGGEILNCGFYRLNKDKFLKARADFLNT